MHKKPHYKSAALTKSASVLRYIENLRNGIMLKKRVRQTSPLLALTLALALATAIATPAQAHQPYFEEADIKPGAPWQINDPTISTALYATLESPTDVDYYTFVGKAGQSILLEITIPQIEGQEEFAPAMALLGPGLPAGSAATDLPRRVARSDDTGAVLLRAIPGPAPDFFEPFSRTAYWERQEERVTVPADGHYVVAVWHDTGQVGRYVFVIGDRERLGGDPAFPVKMKAYWTSVTPPTTTHQCGGGSYR
jgi:hypothetical protein